MSAPRLSLAQTIEYYFTSRQTSQVDINGIAGYLCSPSQGFQNEWQELRARLESGQCVSGLRLEGTNTVKLMWHNIDRWMQMIERVSQLVRERSDRPSARTLGGIGGTVAQPSAYHSEWPTLKQLLSQRVRVENLLLHNGQVAVIGTSARTPAPAQSHQPSTNGISTKLLSFIEAFIKNSNKSGKATFTSGIGSTAITLKRCTKEEWTLFNELITSGKQVGRVRGRMDGNRCELYLVDALAFSINDNALPQRASTNSTTNNLYPAAIIVDAAACRKACAALQREKILAVDCEGVRLGTPNGTLCLVQIASSKGGVYLFDVVSCNALFDNGLRALLESDVFKLVHDCRNDVGALFREHQVRVSNVLDTQVAYKVALNSTRQISLGDFIAETIDDAHPEKKNAPHKKDSNAWKTRPLSQQCIKYAAADVVLLLKAGMQFMDDWFGDDDSVVRRCMQRSLVVVQDRIAGLERQQRSQPTKKGASGGKSGLDRLLALGKAPSSLPLNLDVQNEFYVLMDALPARLQYAIEERIENPEECVIDVVLDVERPARIIRNNGKTIFLEDCEVTEEDLEHVLESCGKITDAHRCCVGQSLHRCSVIYDGDTNDLVGMTLRTARAVHGIAATIEDILVAGKSVLLIGAPGRGKTTLLRDIARVLASRQHDKRVMIVDTNNEIAGESSLPHSAVGRARRMKVGARSRQHRVMLEAVQNHTPEVLIIDEIGTSQEAREAVGVRQRGVQLVATTHGETIADVIQNPVVNSLLGGINVVILSAGERANEGAKSKTRRERKTKPAFDVCIELLSLHRWRVHHDVQAVVDCILRDMDQVVDCEMRHIDGDQVRLSTEPFPNDETKANVDFDYDHDINDNDDNDN